MAPKSVDAHVAGLLTKQGLNKDGFELLHDYAPRSRGKEHSPYARFYKDRKSNKRVMVVSILPHVTADGHKIECGWIRTDGKYLSKTNLFSAIVDGTQIKVTALSDQPSGSKQGDFVQWNPQLYLDNVEQTRGKPTLLTTDPINADYSENTLEWDYGICKRRIRIIEGRIRERWVFTSNPHGEVKIKHNHTGALTLKMGVFKISDDVELVPASVFGRAQYPFEVAASPETFYPDPHVESTSVDGAVLYQQNNTAWSTLRNGAGSGVDDDQANGEIIKFTTGTTLFYNIWRSIFLFDTSGLPDDAAISAATFSVRGYYKDDFNSATPDINVYKSTPFSNIALQADDYVDIGTVALSSVITYGSWNTAGYNDFALNDVDTDDFGYIKKTAGDPITKLGCRNANYDVALTTPPSGGSDKTSRLNGYFSEQGGGSQPKLVVTYTEITNVEITVPLADTVNGATLVPTFVRDMSFAVPLASTVNGAVLTPVLTIEPTINVPLADTINGAVIVPTFVLDMKPTVPLADTVNSAGIAPAMALDTKFAVPLADTINGATLTPTFVRDTKVTVPLATTAIVAISPAIQPHRPWVINRSGLDDDYDTTHTRSGLDDDYSAVRPRSGKSSY